MTEKEIFECLFAVAKTSQDPEGVVAACLVKARKILIASASADDGVRHAEDLVLEKAKKQGITIGPAVTLYTTLEPCSYRSPQNQVKDCTTIILKAGIQQTVFAASDPEFSPEARKRFEKAGVSYRKLGNIPIEKQAIALFNRTIKIPLTAMHLPRKKKLPR